MKTVLDCIFYCSFNNIILIYIDLLIKFDYVHPSQRPPFLVNFFFFWLARLHCLYHYVPILVLYILLLALRLEIVGIKFNGELKSSNFLMTRHVPLLPLAIEGVMINPVKYRGLTKPLRAAFALVCSGHTPLNSPFSMKLLLLF